MRSGARLARFGRGAMARDPPAPYMLQVEHTGLSA